MLTLHENPVRLCDSWSRREVLRAGGLSMLGLTLPGLLQARETAPLGILPTDKMFGRAKNVIFLYLAGGPPQHETFDPKPDAPAEIRGAFQPIQTNVPGIQYCELLPRTAALADKLAIVRSLSTNDNIHSSSSAWVLTGYKYEGPNARTIQATDWPYFGSIVKLLKPSDVLPPLSCVWLPDMMRLNENVTPAGQTAGFLGRQWDPDRFIGDPSQPNYRVEGLQVAEIPAIRLNRRRQLLKEVEARFAEFERGPATDLYSKYQQQAFDLMSSGKARNAFAIDQEPEAVRDRYGRNRWGQCVLLARRLVEAGARLVHVQWPREPGDNAVDNPLWDTHAQNADRLEDVLCPQFDVGFSALIEDLDQRGLLDETLVVAVGEFGRTPKINAKGGRDHWGHVFSCALAGAGISGGQVFGASDKEGAYPSRDRVEPGDLTATIFHLLGIHYQATFHDALGREHRVTSREPLYSLMGEEPAAKQLVKSTGDVRRVPPFDETALLRNTDFGQTPSLLHAAAPTRPKGWRSIPEPRSFQQDGFAVREGKLPDAEARSAWIALGLRLSPRSSLEIAKGTKLLLAQEVRSPFAGTYEFGIRAAGICSGEDEEDFARHFLDHFVTRLVFFEFTQGDKRPTERKLLHAEEVTPRWAPASDPTDWPTLAIRHEFVNPNPGSNFSFGLGLGVAIELEKTSDVAIHTNERNDAFVAELAVAEVMLKFEGKPRNDDVTV